MSLRVGLGASQADLDVQGEIDFDFFEESDASNNSKESVSKTLTPSVILDSKGHSSKLSSENLENGSKINESNEAELEQKAMNIPESSNNYNKPMITVSCDDATGVVKKTTIETVIPTPYTYKDNKCGKLLSGPIKNNKILNSPRFKSKAFKEDNEISDDSSLSSMSDSTLSTESEDSFELDGSDSITDVSPLPSPYTCDTPDERKLDQKPSLEEAKKDGVKFNEEVEKKSCEKCDTIDFRELVKAMNRLQMKQNSRSISTCSGRCSSPVLTHKAKCRKNLSFTNEEVRKIDSDNQNLLKKIVAQQNRTKAPSAASVHIRPSSAVNRQRQQRQIELENLALLKRLETTKPSKNLSRSHLLRDFDRRSSGVLSRAPSSRSSYPSSTKSSNRTSGRSSAISIKSSNTFCHSPSSQASSITDRK
ncbi:hypothetical protein JTE90_000704 [Oedothorax gibbosus]|uniref:Cilia- and flagella-associated protein 97 n=1 Tax=Oedothorax gibbosus TaxID=931172 RepID=A0AAV6UMP5_9ARAC|nr:hypothetical protein JTE90_000704 [Oedothorax gibbosus]